MSSIFERAESDVVFLQGEARIAPDDLAREFDCRSGKLRAQSSGDDVYSRTQLMISYLREASRIETVPAIGQIIDHSPFFVRWYAMREWLALDPLSALPRLQVMARDPDARVRRAAEATLDKLGAHE